MSGNKATAECEMIVGNSGQSDVIKSFALKKGDFFIVCGEAGCGAWGDVMTCKDEISSRSVIHRVKVQ